MHDLERKRDEDLRRSEAVFHYRDEEDMSLEKLPENYHPHWSERDEQRRPRQVFAMSNSYSKVFFAANRNKELTIGASEKRRHDSETLDRDHQKLNGERRKRTVAGPFGWAYTNSFSPANSAFAFLTKKNHPAKRVLSQIAEYVEANDQHVVESSLPFLSLGRDKKRLQGLIGKTGGAGKEERDILGLECEKERLSQDILQKEQMQARFLTRLRLALQKAKLITETGQAEWLRNAVLTDRIDLADTPPPDEEEDLDDDQTGAVHKEDSAAEKKK